MPRIKASRLRQASRLLLSVMLSALLCCSALAEQATIAVAANFHSTLKILVQEFEQRSDHQVIIVSAATGVLFNQIKHGAPYDVLLAADRHHPQQLQALGLATPDSRFSYAIGRLALAFRDSSPLFTELASEGLSAQTASNALNLSTGKVAIANPNTAPYGAAAQQSIEYLQLRAALESKLVFGTNISQSLQFVATGNAELGFVALSQIEAKPPSNTAPLRFWLIPSAWHQAIQQQAVLLQSAQHNKAAVEFIDYLKSASAKTLISHRGYDTPSQSD